MRQLAFSDEKSFFLYPAYDLDFLGNFPPAGLEVFNTLAGRVFGESPLVSVLATLS